MPQNDTIKHYKRNRLTTLPQKHTKMKINQLNFTWNFCYEDVSQ